MLEPSPVQHLHERAEALLLPWGEPNSPLRVVQTYGLIEAEYASARKAVALLDEPHAGTIRITGSEAIGFLNNMLTQQIADLSPCQHRDAFWLNRQGRIEADLRLSSFEGMLLARCDRLVAQHTAATLGGFVFAEDVEIADASGEFHRFVLMGPLAHELLGAVSMPVAGPSLGTLAQAQSCCVRIGAADVFVDRDDIVGAPTLHLCLHRDHAETVYTTLLEGGQRLEGGHALRPIGWHAFNIARLEAGTPLFNIDFGAKNLPAETGVMDARVSFTKGCYLGQEVVARMHSLGHPKQTLVALRAEEDERTSRPDAQPETGTPLIPDETNPGSPVGAVTSSVRSPMLGDAIICFAMVKWSHRAPGTTLVAGTPAGPVRLRVQPSLRHWPDAAVNKQ